MLVLEISANSYYLYQQFASIALMATNNLKSTQSQKLLIGAIKAKIHARNGLAQDP